MQSRARSRVRHTRQERQAGGGSQPHPRVRGGAFPPWYLDAMAPRTWTVWRIGGVAVPIPRVRHDERTRLAATRQWERTFRCTDVDEVQAARIWDQWAAKRGL